MDIQKEWLHLYAMRRSLIGKRILGIRAHHEFAARNQNHAVCLWRRLASEKKKRCQCQDQREYIQGGEF
jgi:hypothetical protein